MKHRVLVSFPEGWRPLMDAPLAVFAEAGMEVDVRWSAAGLPPEELGPLLRDKHAFLMSSDVVTAAMLDEAPDLRVLSKHGVGVDNLDIPAATGKGVVVCNTFGSNANAVADLAIGLLIAITRRVVEADAAARRGSIKPFIGPELSGKTLGIVGFGSIGRQTAKRAVGFGMKVLAYDVFESEELAAKFGIEYVSKDELLARSDFVSLHAPLNSGTHRMIGERELAIMRPGSYLINTARGDLIEEQALARALGSGHLAGAALDVYPTEPMPPTSPLLSAPNLILSTHMGGCTAEALINAAETGARNIISVLSNERPKFVVNPEVYELGTVRSIGAESNV